MRELSKVIASEVYAVKSVIIMIEMFLGCKDTISVEKRKKEGEK